MKRLIPILLTAMTWTSAFAQPLSTGIKDTELSFVQEGGTNGCSVAYNSKLGLYYIAMAGNTEYPLEVKDLQGNAVYSGRAGIDIRGLWYNAKSDRLEGNAFQEGLFAIELDAKGIPGELINISKGTYSNEQACAAFDGKKMIMYYDNGLLAVNFYSLKGHKSKKDIKLTGFSDALDFNSTSVIYTGKAGYEIGLLKYDTNEVYLFNKKTGVLSAIVQLGDGAAAGPMFWFAFANNRVWLYDVNLRVWKGYRIF